MKGCKKAIKQLQIAPGETVTDFAASIDYYPGGCWGHNAAAYSPYFQNRDNRGGAGVTSTKNLICENDA